MKNHYRVKVFLFVRADSPKEAESVAGVILEASTKKDAGIHLQSVVRAGSAKIVLEEKGETK